MPVAAKKNGTASSSSMTSSQPSEPGDQGASSTLNGTRSAITKLTGAASPNASAVSARNGSMPMRIRSPSTIRNVPLAPKPSRATLITRKAKWCHCTIENSRVSRIS